MINLLGKYWKDLIIVLLIIALLFLKQCDQKHTDTLLKQASSYSDTARYYKLMDSVHVATNAVLLLDNSNQIKQLAASKNDTIKKLLAQFKSVQTVVITKSYFKLVHDTVNFHDTIPCDFKPISIVKEKIYYKLFGTLTKTNFVIDTLLVPDKITIVVGEKGTGFLNLHRNTTIDIVHSNPDIIASTIQGYVVAEKKWYDNKIVLLGSAFLIGFTTSSVLHH